VKGVSHGERKISVEIDGELLRKKRKRLIISLKGDWFLSVSTEASNADQAKRGAFRGK